MPPLARIRQENFAQLYVELGVASAAYRQAGYKGKDADVHGHELMVNHGVRARIAEIRREKEEKAQLTKDEAIRLLGQIAKNGQRDSDRIAAANTLGKWCGWDSPQRIIVSENPLMTYLVALRSEPLLKPAAGDTLALEGKEASDSNEVSGSEP
jgi:Terminase small subunit